VIPIYRMLKVLVLGGSLLLLGVLVVLNADGRIVVQVVPGQTRSVTLSSFLFFYAVVLWALALLFALFDRLERRARRSRLIERLRALEQEVEALRKLPLLDRLGGAPPPAAQPGEERESR
jgi:hypothetical protein